jgi:O-glycosyl hydrolase
MRLPLGRLAPSLLALTLSCAAAFAASDNAPLAAPREQAVTITVDPSEKHQRIRGFGASGAWWPNYVADFPAADRDRLLRLLFTSAGADLSIYRYNLPAGEGADVTDRLRRTAQVEIAPGRYDFSRDWKAQRILREVRALGVEQFVLFSKSPPPRLLRNGKVSGGDNGGSNLLPTPEARADFARYLLDLTAHYTKEFDLPDVVLSPINEPQWHWGRDRRHQEGCFYTPDELAATVRALVEEKQKRGLSSVAIEASESGEWKNLNYDFASSLFEDSVITANVRTYAVHSYWSSPDDRRRFVEWFRARYPDKALAMTEYCQMEHGHDLSIESGLSMADVIHEDLVVAGVETWQWWLGVFTGGYKDALIYAHPRTRKIETTKRLWTLANYSRFVRPGATRVGAHTEGDLRVSAYLTPNSRGVALVIINHGDARLVRPVLPDASEGQVVGAWVTSAELDLARRAPDSSGHVTLPAKSITTVTFALTESQP